MDQDSDKTIVPSNLLRSEQHRDAHEQDTSDTLPIGTRLGEFEILGLVGKGGFGIVYRAYDHSLECEVALKEYMPSGLASRSQSVLITVRSRADIDTFNIGLQSFIKEARMLRRFDSPSLVKVFRFWEANGTAYMVMPFYEGMTLKQAVKAKSIVPDEPWIKFFLTNLLDAIDIIHKANCYHRDIAPDNVILLKSDGHPVLLDFGAARRVISDSTQLQTAILKPGFAPIEQYADIPGFRQGPWTDIYALGALVYYLITGRAPVAAVSRVVNDNNIPAREAGKGRFSQSFLHAIDRAIAVRPEHRIQTAAELREAIGLPENLSRTLPPSAKPKSQPTQRIEPVFPDAVSGMTEANPASWKEVPFFKPSPTDKPTADTDRRRKMTLIGGAAALAVVIVSTAVYLVTKSPSNVQARNKPAVEKRVASSSDARRATEADAIAGSAVPPVAEQKPLPATDGQARPANSSAAKENPGKRAEQAVFVRQAEAEEQFWANTLAFNSVSSYEAYQKAYPNGKYALAAASAIEKLASITPADRRTSPSGPASTGIPAPAKIDAVTERTPSAKPAKVEGIASDEEDIWRIISSMDNLPAYESYLNKYPNGKYAARARSKIQEGKKTTVAATAGSPDIAKGPDTTKPTASGPVAKAPVVPVPPPMVESKNNSPPAEQIVAAIPRIPGPSSSSSPVVDPPVGAKPSNALPVDAAPGTGTSAAQDASMPPAPLAQPSGQVLRIGNQTLTGNFSHDPVKGLVSGSGQVSWSNGDRFEGTLVRGIKQGRGDFIWANGQRYRGEWSRDLPNGKGIMTFQNGNIFEGDMKDGEPNGKGSLIFGNGHRYRGEVKDGLPHGKGTMRFSNGDSYFGEWRLGKSHGQGRYVWANKAYWEGEFKDDKRTDNGKMVTAAEATADGALASASPSKDVSATDESNAASSDLKK